MRPVYDECREGFIIGWIVSSVLFLLALGVPPPQTSNQPSNQQHPQPLRSTDSLARSLLTAQVPAFSAG